MNNTAFTAITIAVMGAIGIGAYLIMGSGGLQSFDYETASASERSSFLEKKARGMKNSFKPNYLAKVGQQSVSGEKIRLVYNTGMGSVACGTGVDCEVMQCKRYLKNGVSKYNVAVQLTYTNNKGRKIDSQSLSTRSCQSKIKSWDAGAERRKAKKIANKKAMCSDDYIGMKPMGC